MPFDESLATARELGIKLVWFSSILNEPPIESLTDAQVDRLAKRVASHDQELVQINCGVPFKHIHLTELNLKTMTDNPKFRSDIDALIRSMQIASRIGVRTVGSYTFAWPGEYSAGKPTWPM